jgi:transcriptional regulator with XRE-family HTH domain
MKGKAIAEQRASRQGLREDLGIRLRNAREQRNVGLRELARRIGVSASLISQIENGKSEPSISTLFAIVGELGLPVNEIVWDSAQTSAAPAAAPAGGGADGQSPASRVRLRGAGVAVSPMQDPDSRATIHIESGVSWQRLTAQPDHDVDFLYLRYEPGSESTPARSLMRHNGREFGYVLSGTLQVTIGFDTYEVAPGFSIAFDCTEPHRLANVGDEPVEAIWFVVGRRHTMAHEEDSASMG